MGAHQLIEKLFFVVDDDSEGYEVLRRGAQSYFAARSARCSVSPRQVPISA
ncbi:hypothetical protein [Mycobacterium paragordonae]|uniref:Uncharacterized protein n=1 Tax=Mycobacterium paragordonae TaxID=1389713 RepID=A0AAJ1SJH4_9MYCO|nr:hypothetical protein [Mycobacterium paragordonae]MDP7739373.1 hypothetical protein [Mycobacterium paragordonae]